MMWRMGFGSGIRFDSGIVAVLALDLLPHLYTNWLLRRYIKNRYVLNTIVTVLLLPFGCNWLCCFRVIFKRKRRPTLNRCDTMQLMRFHSPYWIFLTVLTASFADAHDVLAMPPGITLLPPRSTSNYTILDNLITDHVPVCSELIECSMPKFDFGRRKGGQPVLCTFPIKNISSQLVYLRVNMGCSCSRSFRSPILLPGRTVYVNPNMNTKKGSGEIDKPITVHAKGIQIPKPIARALRSASGWWQGLSRHQQLGLFCIKGILLGRKFS